MDHTPAYRDTDLNSLPRVPSWVTSSRAETLEDVAFLSGAALATLHLVVRREEVRHSLLRERLALGAAEACAGFAGRSERAGDLRDSVHFLRSGDQPGPAGDIYLHWRRAVERPISIKALHQALPAFSTEQIAGFLNARLRGATDAIGATAATGAAGGTGAIARVSALLETVLHEFPREEAAAFILADAALAQALGWDHVMPLLATGLKSRDLRKTGDNLRLACHQASIVPAGAAVRLAGDLARRVARVRAVTPKLRAKGAGAAVELFPTRDAVMPAALIGPADSVGRTGRSGRTDRVGMSDRAARRFCDRLVELGVARELTCRDTFRLYGV